MNAGLVALEAGSSTRLPGTREALLALLCRRRVYFFKSTGLGRWASQGAGADRQSASPDPEAGAPANSRSSKTPCFLTCQMSVAQHAAAATCETRFVGGSGRQPGTWLTPWMASVEAR